MSGTSDNADLFANKQAVGEKGDDFLIVGMGASAGGITAFKQFFERVPATSGMAYVVILHLSPDHDSKLAEILQASAAIPVAQVVESIRIEPNHIYVIPPNKSLSMNDGVLELSEIKGYEERRAPVDIFFRTLAMEHTTRAVSVILSGTGANGSMGVKRVKEMGGIILVQDPQEAEYSDMPRNSIATGLVDYVLPVAEIPSKLIAYKENLKEVRIPVEAPERAETDEHSLRDIFTQLRVRTRHDFSNYKRATILRRIERRINVHELTGLPAYARFMREHQEEAQALLKDLLISVTNFFRDPDSFQWLEQNIIPQLFAGKGAGDYVRVWVTGCATGEEAYSITMMLLDYTAKLGVAPTVQVFATDIDEQAVSVARDGFYTDTDAADVSPERLRRYFTKETDGYRVRREVRETVLFAHHNLIKDPPFSHLDMATCRNLLIYLNRTAQERVMQVMHFALNSGGYLFLGTSESVEGAGDLFAIANKEAHVYQSRGVSPRVMLPVPELSLNVLADQRPRAEQSALEPRARGERLTYSELHHRLIEQYGAASVVVNEEYDIIHLSERADRYLQFTKGDATLNLLKVVRPELRMDLRTALYQAARKRTNVEARGIATRLDNAGQMVNLMVRPALREDDTARGFFLVQFEETPADENAESDATAESVIPVDPAALHLEEELTRVKVQLRSNVDQYETQAEEMKASNEELQAMNEELRSSAEELETSKEELQSLNEELHTINQELKIKIEELSNTNNDFRNLISSTDIGTIFLDRSLHIKLFTPRSREIFNLISADINRPLSNISSNLVEDGLLGELEKVLDSLQTVEREVTALDGRSYLMRLLPYRTADDRIEGVVLTFVDVTSGKRAEEAVRASEERLQRAINIETVGVIFFNNSIEITDCNEAFLRMSGFTRDEIRAGRFNWEVFTPEEFVEPSRRAIEELRTRGFTTPYEKEYFRKDGTRFWALFACKRISENEMVEFVTDITEQKRAEAAVRESEARLRLALDASEMGTFIWYPQEDRTEPDARTLTLFGLHEGDAITLAEALATMIHPDDREFYAAAVARAVDPNGDGKLDVDYRIVHPNRSLRWLHIYGHTFFAGANSPRASLMYGMVLDITERKRTEANLAFLAETGADFAPLLYAGEIMERVGKRVAGYLNLSRCNFSVVDEESDRIENIYAWRRDDSLPELLGAHRISTFLNEEGRRHYAAGKLSVINDARNNPLLNQAAFETSDELGLRSIVDAPYLKDGRWKFLLTVTRSEASEWRADEIELVRELAERIYIRIERARAEEALRESEAKLAIELVDTQQLQSISNLLIEEENIDALYERILESAVALMRSDMGSLQVLDAERNELHLLAWKGFHPDAAAFWEKVNAQTGSSCGAALSTGERLIIPDIKTSEFLKDSESRKYYKLSGITAVQTTPLISRDGHVVGMVSTHWRAAHTPGERELRMLDVLARQTADLIERRRAEEALRESEGRLRALVENLPGGAVFIVDKNLRYLVAQGEALTTAGFKPKDLIGRTIGEAMPPELAASYEPMYRTALAGESFEHEHEAHDRTFISRGVPLTSAGGEIYAVLAISYDITERKEAEERLRESEERLRLLVESVKDYAIFMLDSERRVRSWNPGAELTFGYTESEIIGQAGDILFTPEDREQGAPQMEVGQARSTGRAADERWHIRKDGTRFYASGVLAALSGGGRQGFVKIARDLTHQKRAEEELQRAHDELEERVRVRTSELFDLNQTLLAEVKERTAAEEHARHLMRQLVTAQEDERRKVAHDLHDHLGQQLTGLRLKLQSHKEGCGDDEKSCAEIEQIQAIAERLDADVDFLAWELRPASLDEFGLTFALANFVQEWSKHFNTPAEFHTTGMDQERLPPEVEINLYRIAQEALNNISKHAEADGVDVLLERRDGHVEMIVEDDGKGFEPEMGTKLVAKKIGLLNMRERAAFVGGTLEIESTPNEGTTIFARVPVRAEDLPRESRMGREGESA